MEWISHANGDQKGPPDVSSHEQLRDINEANQPCCGANHNQHNLFRPVVAHSAGSLIPAVKRGERSTFPFHNLASGIRSPVRPTVR
jgi:hypothetical protein